MDKVKIALISPRIALCDPEYNATVLAKEAALAAEDGARVIAFPELALTGATAGDLYFQEALTDAADAALAELCDATADIEAVCLVGLPVKQGEKLYNAVCAIYGGEIIGVSAACGLSTRSRLFSPAPDERIRVTVAGQQTVLGGDLVYGAPLGEGDTRVKIFVKIGDDDAPIPEGANLLINPAAAPEYITLAAARRAAVCKDSRSMNMAYAYVGAADGESGTDGIYAGARLVAVGGEVIAESELFSTDVLVCEVELGVECENSAKCKEEAPRVTKTPFIPEDKAEREEALSLAIELQARALALRIERSYSKCAVLGVSGGLDSTLAVLVAARAMDILSRPREAVIAITMPCFGTTERTKSNALALAEELGCTARTIDIKAAVTQHFKDISHPEDKYDVVYENSQARERTQILMDVANAEGGLVVGTGDLSELALGFATYNGDHMSMYCVNGSVPKTLMRAVISHAADKALDRGEERLSRVLYNVINTPVSPELLPADGAENKQHTEKIVGPYELHDFFLWHTIKSGASPARVLKLAAEAFAGEYSEDEIRGYLEIFVRRFYSQQFKRSCMPDGPLVSPISLSPRGAWQMPSDISSAVWRKSVWSDK